MPSPLTEGPLLYLQDEAPIKRFPGLVNTADTVAVHMTEKALHWKSTLNRATLQSPILFEEAIHIFYDLNWQTA